MLARRSYARRVLFDRLRERFSEDEAEAAVERLAGLGLLDDRDYAERFVRDRFDRAGYGPHRIRRDLLRKGVDSTVADIAIQSAVSADDERHKAIDVLARFRRRRPRARAVRADSGAHEGREAGRNEAQAAYRHLIGKGFSASLVRDLLDVSL
jgi:regulatory protein